ncbi:MAG: phosphate propanoyltransferase [Elusimicrobiota bacterium]
MDENLIKDIISDIKLREERSKMPVPAGVSNRHVHLTEKDFTALFGPSCKPTLYRKIVQPGFFACNEKVDIETPKGKFKGVRMIGPCRDYTQIEISLSDARVLGLNPPIRDSGKIENSPGIKIIGPAGEIEVKKGVIISKRHIHFSPQDALKFKIKDQQTVRVLCSAGTDKETIYESVLCRVSDKYALEFHLDTDEANAAAVKTGDPVFIV